jgi:hypothetical protein
MPDRTVFESYNPVTRRSTELVIDGETGLPLIVHVQDTKPIIEHCKRLAANFQGTNRQDITQVASIPLVIWRQLQMLGITRDEAALNKWLDERDNRVFRTDDARRLS